MNSPRRQKGVALITALLIVAIAVVLASALVDHLFLDIRRTENMVQSDQAYSYAISTEELVRFLLYADSQRDDYDDNLQLQDANSLLLAPVPGGQVVANLQDLQGRFNLNNLSKTNPNRNLAHNQFQKLLTTLGLDPNLVYPVEDWIDTDQQVDEPAYGAEFDYYIGLEPPYRSADKLMSSPSELRLVKGFNKAEIYDAVIPFVCALPGFTSININTAGPEVLESLDNVTNSDVQQIIDYRDGPLTNTEQDGQTSSQRNGGSSFETLNDFQAYMRNTLNKNNFVTTGLSVGSDYFLLVSDVEIGNGRSRLFSILHRNANGATSVVSRSQGDW